MVLNKSQKQELERLLDSVVNRNGGINSLMEYYKDQNLNEDNLFKDLYMQIPPLDRQAFVQSFTLDAVNFSKLLPTIKEIIKQWI